MSGISLRERNGSGKMIPSWLRFYQKKEVLTDEQKAILKALADPVENTNDKFLYDSWRYKKEYKDES